MEPTNSSVILQFIKEYWAILSAFVAFAVGYIELRVNFKEHRKQSDEKMDQVNRRIDRLEDELKDDIKVIMGDVKKLLSRSSD
jgi:uncharacterized membrane-anchored protein YhcB (DUF1043 family)